MTKEAIIVDIDGTVANLTHRRHFVEGKPRNWPAFFAAAVDDTPIEPVIKMVKSAKLAGADIVFCSGRPEDTREVTEAWLRDVAGFKGDFAFDALFMRKAGDFRADDIVKEELLDQILEAGFDPQIVFDDRQRVVDMWRRRGLICAQVAPGAF